MSWYPASDRLLSSGWFIFDQNWHLTRLDDRTFRLAIVISKFNARNRPYLPLNWSGVRWRSSLLSLDYLRSHTPDHHLKQLSFLRKNVGLWLAKYDGKTQFNGWQDSIRWMARLNTMDGKTQYDGWQDSIRWMARLNNKYLLWSWEL